jgi:hypothetical protein
MTTPTNYRAACEAAGWREYLNSAALQRICGEPHGIAHTATIEGTASHNDSIYETWRDCWLEAVSPWPPDQQQAMGEGWCIMWSDRRQRWLIQRDDEAGKFPNDEAAREHVEDQARHSAYHRDILDMLRLVNG